MGVADTYGNPAHSLACVVELGSATAAQVAQAIYDNRGIITAAGITEHALTK